MAAHGYQVISVPMPFRASAHRKLAFSNWRERQTCMNGFHFIMGPATFSEFESQLQLVPNSSVTIIGNHFPILKFNFWQIPFRYRVHQWVCKLSKVKPERYEHTLTASDPLVYDRFLDHCVELAEDEVMGAQQ